MVVKAVAVCAGRLWPMFRHRLVHAQLLARSSNARVSSRHQVHVVKFAWGYNKDMTDRVENDVGAAPRGCD
jgi:hypothetical protein